ncbi:MAG TPA: DNA polymerase [Methanomicrobia archaeon]|nr:DNA polymerase [Methanomicrobia archaeon]
MEKEGFLLDADYLVEKDAAGVEKPVIRLWCKSTDAEDFVILDGTFEPYFYALSHNYPSVYGRQVDLEESKSLVEGLVAFRNDEEIRVKRVEYCQKKLLGATRNCYKIVTALPRDVPVLREEVRKCGLIALEADILFAIRYLIDKGLRPFDGVHVTGEVIETDHQNTGGRTAIRADHVEYKAMSGTELPALKVLAFDCEMVTRGGHGMPSPSRDPIVIIAVACSDVETCTSQLFVLRDDEFEAGDDARVLREFLDYIRDRAPEIIVGYNSDAFDWPYIHERARMHGIRLTVGADGSTIQFDRGGMLPGLNIAGRLNVDLFKLAKRDLGSVKVKTLENVADFLGVMLKSERVDLSPREINECWFAAAVRERLYEYAKADVVSTLGIAEQMLPLQIELARMVGYPLDDVAKMGRGRQVEAFLTAEAFKRNELVPAKGGTEKTFEGAFVFQPEQGLHEDVIALDFSSMYPTIMISFNVSPDTYVAVPAEDEELYRAPEVGHAFKKEPEGFFKSIMSDLITRRRALKQAMKHHERTSTEYRILDIQQQTIKILTNSFYGYTGWSAAKFYKRECAEATTAWGRYFIKQAIQMAEEQGFQVIYSDTDSIFAKLANAGTNAATAASARREATLKKANELSLRISKELPLELELQDFFRTIFFTGKKKRYAALTDKGEIVVRGLEVRRGDWCELAKAVQTEVIQLILVEKDHEQAMKCVKGIIQQLKAGSIPLDELVIHKTLTRRIDGYETKQAHVVAATRAAASSARIVYEVGSKIPYVIIKGSGKTSDRAFPVDIIERSNGIELYADGQDYQIDSEYYIRHQIIPVAHRVLQLFGYERSSFEEGAQRTLEGFHTPPVTETAQKRLTQWF